MCISCLVQENGKKKKKSVGSSASSSASTQERQLSIRKFLISKKITIPMTSVQFRNYIIELVVKNSFPLSDFCKPAMQDLLGEIAKKLKVKLDSNCSMSGNTKS